MFASWMRAAALAALVAAGGAMAQQPARPAPAAPAPAAAISPSHLEAAKELALMLKIDEPLSAVLDEMQKQIVNAFTITRPELKNDLVQVLQNMNPQIAEKRDEMVDAGARVFATRFTEAEIGDLVKFLKTPLGQKYLHTQPEAMAAYLQEVRAWIGRLNDFVITNVRAEMKKKGHDL